MQPQRVDTAASGTVSQPVMRPNAGAPGLCSGTAMCVIASIPYYCAVDPTTVKTCDTTKDGTCAGTVCLPSTGECVKTAITEGKPCGAGDAQVCVAGVCQQRARAGTPDDTTVPFAWQSCVRPPV